MTKTKKPLPYRAQPEGTRVEFQPNPVSLALYSVRPARGDQGTVVSVPVPGGRKTFMKGPGGGLLYVKWDTIGVCGVAPADCVRAR